MTHQTRSTTNSLLGKRPCYTEADSDPEDDITSDIYEETSEDGSVPYHQHPSKGLAPKSTPLAPRTSKKLRLTVELSKRPVSPKKPATAPCLQNLPIASGSHSEPSEFRQPPQPASGPSTSTDSVPRPANSYLRPEEETAIPGVFTDQHLNYARLGLLCGYGVLYCLECTAQGVVPPVGLPICGVVNHRSDKHKFPRARSDKKLANLIEMLPRYGAWAGPDSGLSPIPVGVVAPFPFLDTIKSIGDITRGRTQPEACGDCQEEQRWIWIAASSREVHYDKKHPDISKSHRTPPDIVDAVQTFYKVPGWQRYFPVNPELARIPDNPEPEEELSYEALKSYLAKSTFTKMPTIEPMGTSQGLLDDNPFLHSQGWSKHFSGWHPQDLMSLVSEPDSNHPWFPIVPACLALFRRYLDTLPKTPQIIRDRWVKSQETGDCPWYRTLATIEEDTTKDYARFFAQFINLVLVTYQRISNPSRHPVYTAYLTTEQMDAAKDVVALLKSRDPESADGQNQLSTSIHKLAVTCFAPQNIDHIAESKYNDITHVYVALKAVRSDSTFCHATSIARPSTGLQYAFRAALLEEARLKIKSFKTADECYEYYHSYLVYANRPTPFCNLKAMRKLMFKEIWATAGKRRLHWSADQTICVYDGHSLKLDSLKDMALDILDELERILFLEVLFGIPLSELYTDPDLLKLRDVMGESGNRYSIWRDIMNEPLHEMRSNLISAFITHKKVAKKFWTNRLPDGTPNWIDDARHEWLRTLGKCSRHLALACHIWGGLPRRGPELLNARNHNAEGRDRNVFLFGEDIVLMLGYTKSTALTGLDRMDVHALPPRLTRIVFIMNSLIRPLAVKWVEDLIDPLFKTQPSHTGTTSDDLDELPDDDFVLDELDKILEDVEDDQEQVTLMQATPNIDQINPETSLDDETETVKTRQNIPILPSKIQDAYLFTFCGRKFKTGSIGGLLGYFSHKHTGVRLTFTAWRHIIIAVEREHLLIQDPNELPRDTFFTNQAAHTGILSAHHYALRDDDRNLVSGDSFDKYVAASRCLHRWFNREPQPRGPVERISSDVQETKEDVQSMKGKMAVMEIEMKGMREDMQSMKEELAQLRAEKVGWGEKMSEISKELGTSRKTNERMLFLLEKNFS
ncbi:hypothetical protein FS749_004439 [Ceratobasidium sp. UAMH 11750]|nr:hypothetical protein FS749_004439 [Ceratobasidium sp. UAMH 11750]